MVEWFSLINPEQQIPCAEGVLLGGANVSHWVGLILVISVQFFNIGPGSFLT